MKFKKKEKGKFVMYWACGTIIEIDGDNKERIYCEFLDGEKGWYDLEYDKEGRIETRRCEEREGHVRNDSLKLLMIDEKYKNKKRKLKRSGDKQKVKLNENHRHTSTRDDEEGSTDLEDTEKPRSELFMRNNSIHTTLNETMEIEVGVLGKSLKLNGTSDQILMILEKLIKK